MSATHGTDAIGEMMIDPVEQTDFQKLEATTRGSLARQMVAEAIRRKRRDHRWWMACIDRFGHEHRLTVGASAECLSSHNLAETLRRILYGLEL